MNIEYDTLQPFEIKFDNSDSSKPNNLIGVEGLKLHPNMLFYEIDVKPSEVGVEFEIAEANSILDISFKLIGYPIVPKTDLPNTSVALQLALSIVVRRGENYVSAQYELLRDIQTFFKSCGGYSVIDDKRLKERSIIVHDIESDIRYSISVFYDNRCSTCSRIYFTVDRSFDRASDPFYMSLPVEKVIEQLNEDIIPLYSIARRLLTNTE